MYSDLEDHLELFYQSNKCLISHTSVHESFLAAVKKNCWFFCMLQLTRVIMTIILMTLSKSLDFISIDFMLDMEIITW